MKKLILFLIGAILLLNLVAATDVAYIVTKQSKVNNDFVSALNELGMTYTTILGSNAAKTDFSNFKLILLNNEDFANAKEIPINNYPALLVNGKNMADWGWVTYISKSKQTTPFHANIVDLTHAIANGFSKSDVQIYNSQNAELYYLGKDNTYKGIKIAVSTKNSDKDALIAYAEAGTTLTYPTKPSTEVKANTIFFGIADSQYWTPETKKLFKNSLLWLAEGSSYADFNLGLSDGINLVSIPVKMDSMSVNDFISKNPRVVSVKGYVNGEIKDVSQFENGKAYFIKTVSDGQVIIRGKKPTGEQKINLVNGMNLVGINSLNNISLSLLPDGIVEISKRKADGSYETATKYIFGWYNQFNLEPGKGYWVKTNKEVVWSYAP